VSGLIGTKIGMTQVFGESGELIPVTVVRTGPCTITQIRTQDCDGYDALQIGFGAKSAKRIGKAMRGHLAKANKEAFKVIAEFRLNAPGEYSIGQELKVGEVFAKGDTIDVTGTSKGKGFQGVVRRHGYGGQTATHGTHESFRGAGGIGACAYPGRVFKGKPMPGHMGNKKRTVQNLEVVAVRPEDDVLLIRGGIPGSRGCEVVIRPAVKGGGNS